MFILSVVVGSLLGVYYGKNRLPFPIVYCPPTKREKAASDYVIFGEIKIDFGLFNCLIKDIASMTG